MPIAAVMAVVAGLVLAGCVVDIGAPPGYLEAEATDVNVHGLATVTAHGEADRAFIVDVDGDWIDLGTLAGDPATTPTSARAINDDGVVVGLTRGEVSGDGFAWDAAGGMQLLGHLPGTTMEQPNDVNADGVVIGTSLVTSPQLASKGFLWTPETEEMIELPPLLPDDTFVEALAINDGGQVVGRSAPVVIGTSRAVLWAPPLYRPVELEVPDTPFPNNHATGINDLGVVVGMVGQDGAVWDVSGTLTRITGGRPADIADDGTIVGTGRIDGHQSAVRWAPGATQATSLGTLGGGTSVATAIEGTHIVGSAPTPTGDRPRHPVRFTT